MSASMFLGTKLIRTFAPLSSEHFEMVNVLLVVKWLETFAQ